MPYCRTLRTRAVGGEVEATSSWYKFFVMAAVASNTEPFVIQHLPEWNDAFSPDLSKARTDKSWYPRSGTCKTLFGIHLTCFPLTKILIATVPFPTTSRVISIFLCEFGQHAKYNLLLQRSGATPPVQNHWTLRNIASKRLLRPSALFSWYALPKSIKLNYTAFYRMTGVHEHVSFSDSYWRKTTTHEFGEPVRARRLWWVQFADSLGRGPDIAEVKSIRTTSDCESSQQCDFRVHKNGSS